MKKIHPKDSRRPKDVRPWGRTSDGAPLHLSDICVPLHCPLCTRAFALRLVGDGKYGLMVELIAAWAVSQDGVIAKVTDLAPDTVVAPGDAIVPVNGELDAFPEGRGFDDDETPVPPCADEVDLRR